MERRAPAITLMVAVAENGVIGRAGALPWRLSADLKRFKQLTLGKPVVMGRKTWESIGRALPGRRNIVITRQADYRVTDPEVAVVADLSAALAAAGDVSEVVVIGGAEIYALAMPRADRIELTRVRASVEGDTFLPSIPSSEWIEAAREDLPADERNDYPMSFVTLHRQRPVISANAP
jgi:dihydrofolate reductase